MTDVPEVKFEKEGTEKMQWGKGGLFFRYEGGKKVAMPKTFAAATGILFGASSLASLFNVEVDVVTPGGIEVSINMNEEKLVDIPLLVEKTGGEGSFPGGRRGGGGSFFKFTGLQQVKRKDSDVMPPGILAKAKLISGASNGPVRAQLLEPIQVNGDTKFEAGVTLFGRGQSTEERLFVQFTQVVLRDGTVVALDAQACDVEDQIVGLKGSKVNRELLRLGASAGLNFAGGLSSGLQETEAQGFNSVKKTTLKNALLNGASQADVYPEFRTVS